MSYTYELENGQQLVIENDGGETLVSLSSGTGDFQLSHARHIAFFIDAEWGEASTRSVAQDF